MRRTKIIDMFFRWLIDMVALIILFGILSFFSIIIGVIYTGSREQGLFYGFQWSFFLGIIAFYIIMGIFNFIWTIAQTALNIILTIGEFILIYWLKENKIYELTDGFELLIYVAPMLVAINRQLIDTLTCKFNGQRRVRQLIRFDEEKI